MKNIFLTYAAFIGIKSFTYVYKFVVITVICILDNCIIILIFNTVIIFYVHFSYI